MKYLILGGAGFIGSNLAHYLIKASKSNFVTVIDNLSTGSIVNLDDLIHDKNIKGRFAFYQGDIANKEVFEYDYMLSSLIPDIIFNLACPASPKWYMADPIKTIKTSVNGTLNSLEYAKWAKARYFFSSTSEVYGDPLEHPQHESYHGNVNTWGPRACYDESKRLAETICYEYSKNGDVDIRIARIFNTYGPRMAEDDGRVVSNFIIQALAKKPITIYGTGKQTRSFCYIDDMLKGILTLCASDIKTPTNIGNPNEFTLNQLAEIVINQIYTENMFIPNQTYKYYPLPQDDPKQRRPDISIMNKLEWTPEIQLKQGIQKTIKYFKSKTNML